MIVILIMGGFDEFYFLMSKHGRTFAADQVVIFLNLSQSGNFVCRIQL